MVYGEQKKRFHQLRLDRIRPHRKDGFAGEYRRSLRNGPYVAGKPKGAQILQKRLGKNASAPQK